MGGWRVAVGWAVGCSPGVRSSGACWKLGALTGQLAAGSVERTWAALLPRGRLGPEVLAPPLPTPARPQDGNGTLCADEVAAALGGQLGIDEGELRALIRQHDTNGDGVIDWPEFLAMLRGSNAQLQRAATSLRRGSLAATP